MSTAQGELVEKFATGVVHTGGKFAAGVIDTGGNFPPVSLTPVENLPLVSLTPAVHLDLRISLQIFKKIWNDPTVASWWIVSYVVSQGRRYYYCMYAKPYIE